MVAEPESETRPAAPQGLNRRVVVLGASNTVRGVASLVAALERSWGKPVDLLAALGHGRAYATTSRVLQRRLPAIRSCKIWEHLAARERLPTAGLVTDIGNDLIYGVSLERTLEAVEQCVAELAPYCDRLVVTKTPLSNVAQLGETQFKLMRTALFPRSQLELGAALEAMDALNQALDAFAGRYRAYVIAPRPQWYGWDPIHILRGCYPDAWATLLAPVRDGQPGGYGRATWRNWLRLRCQFRQLERTWFGWDRGMSQPAGKLTTGTVVSYF